MTRPKRRGNAALPGVILFLLVAAAGFVALGLGWRVAARTLYVPDQLSAVVSGGIGGMALILTGITLARVQDERRGAALERADLDAVITEATRVLDALERRKT